MLRDPLLFGDLPRRLIPVPVPPDLEFRIRSNCLFKRKFDSPCLLCAKPQSSCNHFLLDSTEYFFDIRVGVLVRRPIAAVTELSQAIQHSTRATAGNSEEALSLCFSARRIRFSDRRLGVRHGREGILARHACPSEPETVPHIFIKWRYNGPNIDTTRGKNDKRRTITMWDPGPVHPSFQKFSRSPAGVVRSQIRGRKRLTRPSQTTPTPAVSTRPV